MYKKIILPLLFLSTFISAALISPIEVIKINTGPTALYEEIFFTYGVLTEKTKTEADALFDAVTSANIQLVREYVSKGTDCNFCFNLENTLYTPLSYSLLHYKESMYGMKAVWKEIVHILLLEGNAYQTMYFIELDSTHYQELSDLFEKANNRYKEWIKTVPLTKSTDLPGLVI